MWSKCVVLQQPSHPNEINIKGVKTWRMTSGILVDVTGRTINPTLWTERSCVDRRMRNTQRMTGSRDEEDDVVVQPMGWRGELIRVRKERDGSDGSSDGRRAGGGNLRRTSSTAGVTGVSRAVTSVVLSGPPGCLTCSRTIALRLTARRITCPRRPGSRKFQNLPEAQRQETFERGKRRYIFSRRARFPVRNRRIRSPAGSLGSGPTVNRWVPLSTRERGNLPGDVTAIARCPLLVPALLRFLAAHAPSAALLCPHVPLLPVIVYLRAQAPPHRPSAPQCLTLEREKERARCL